MFLSWALQNKGTLYPIFFNKTITYDRSILNPSISISPQGTATIVFRCTDYRYLRPARYLRNLTSSGAIEYVMPRRRVPFTSFFFAAHDFSTQINSASVLPIEVDKVYLPLFAANLNIHHSSIEDLRICRVNNKLILIGNILWEEKMRRPVYFEIKDINHDSSQVEIEGLEIINSDNLNTIEKNWVPIEDVSGTFVKWPIPTELFRVSQAEAKTSSFKFSKFQREFFGGSPLVNYKNGYLSVVHSRVSGQRFNNHRYFQAVILYNSKFEIIKMSKPFTFMGYETEFCSGISVYADKVFFSFSCNDSLNFVLSIEGSAIFGLDN